MKTLFSFFAIAIFLFSCSEKKNPEKDKNHSNLSYEKAIVYRNSSISDSAFYHFSVAKDIFLKTSDSIGAAKSLINMAIIQSNQGDFHGGIETSLEANRYLKNEKDSITKSLLAANYNNMGISSASLYRYQNAVDSYKKAIEYSTIDKNKNSYYNNLGVALLNLDKIETAKNYFKIALKTNDSLDYYRAFNNLTQAKYLENKKFNPIPGFNKALEVRIKNNDIAGQNSSYAYLSEYYMAKDKKIAFGYAQKMYQKAKELNNSEDELQAIQKIIYLNSDQSLKYFNRFTALNDSVQRKRNETKDQFAYIRFGVEKEKTENSKLKADTAQQEKYILQQYFALATLAVILIAISILFYIRQKIQRQKNTISIKNTELKYSKKVHDVVANGIYKVMTEIENQEEIDKEGILYKLESVYEKSRNISYESEKNKTEELYHETISKLLSTFQSEKRKIFIIGNENHIWESISEPARENIFHIIQEFMVNMKKHSQANRVVVRFAKTNNWVQIFYSDNGIGVSPQTISKNGWRNAVNRTESLNGIINFETETEKGLKIHLQFPDS